MAGDEVDLVAEAEAVGGAASRTNRTREGEKARLEGRDWAAIVITQDT
jgi:hypothetical protein